jgi:hypothetical protein
MSWHAFVVGKILGGDHVDDRKENHGGVRASVWHGKRKGGKSNFLSTRR